MHNPYDWGISHMKTESAQKAKCGNILVNIRIYKQIMNALRFKYKLIRFRFQSQYKVKVASACLFGKSGEPLEYYR